MKSPIYSIRLLLIRHGSTSWNAEHRYIGSTDMPLDSEGSAQAASLAEHFAPNPPDRIYSSSLKRAASTAGAIAESCSLTPVHDVRLAEMHFGVWEGLPLKEIKKNFAEEFTRWSAGEHLPELEIEPPWSMQERASAFLEQVRKNHAGETVMVVSHGGIMQALICSALSIPFQSGWHFYVFNGSVSEIWLMEGLPGVLVRLNDRNHLETG